ncbi:YfiR/HmsC family protein [Aquimarina gracilis]|uniref:histidine kinase n=1 Tax=Aquimarina gracilis TaxID=874422 RepID=A0ABU5ZV55_9FLAO|nr:YfiR/HmsC family protein [Aquimarina gracilis]MEB3345775.1 YfiR/HmsC family protein [Aquimarina gracilis]
MMNTYRKIFAIKNNLILIISLVIASLFSLKCYGQDTSNEQVKRLQRAIFVFNFAQQVGGWPDFETQESFKIGVLGPDRTVLDLQAMALKRKIYNKPVEIVRFHRVKEVKDVQLLYVNHKFNYGIHYILGKISGKNILLVSEDYNFNSSMINMVNVEDSFVYEINSDRLKNEGFVIAPTLPRHAISSAEKWKRLYRKTERSLNLVQETNQEQDSIIKDRDKELQNQKDKITNQLEKIGHQQKEIDHREEEISAKNRRIESLYTKSQLQQKKFEEKILIEQELEKKIQEQVGYIKSQGEKIENSNFEIDEQNKYLEEQREKIIKQEEVLDQQASEISAQKKVNFLLICLVMLFLGVAFFVYRGYLNKKKFNKELQEKNLAIHEQSVQLEAKNKELEQFAYIASHDLQEPLNTISSFIGLISEDYGDSFDDVGKESLAFIKDASVRMKKLIDSLLEYSRLGRNKEYVEVDLNKVFGELKKDLGTIIEKTGARIDVGKLPRVKGSEIELRLVLQNLISNAIKFREPNKVPEIEISSVKVTDLSDDGSDFWKFSVKDNGIGIPEEHKDRIFAIFQRLHTREEYKGTGIGLAHCKKIVESHGGKIWLSSEKGKGSTFYFTIPG